MKGFIYFIIFTVGILGVISIVWSAVSDVTLEEQIEFIKYKFEEIMPTEAASNTADSASKLGNVLKERFNEAQDVYQNGAEAKYE